MSTKMGWKGEGLCTQSARYLKCKRIVYYVQVGLGLKSIERTVTT